MIPKNAKIQQTQFVVLESSVKVCISKETSQIDVSQIPIEIDFDILQNIGSEPYTARVVMTIKGNCNKEVAGYEIFLRVGGEYQLSTTLEVMGDEFKALVSFSAVACLINEVRVYLQTLTAFFPFDSYILPMIDMKDLWEQKSSNGENADADRNVSMEKKVNTSAHKSSKK